ncbi:MAG: NUDIX domain-containing protein [Gammaproteobacteria bacterium]|nr:NUDIX domain-containing protein [Gammaproteobacteria bacterium]MBU2058606.1 NUDIX domain-containing protein [Gammaproteobacteria bacterium]MBU2173558.1 NUDIX domain-containing protein [Gammaproteobacteria bacterium]MBU2246512.1 NUDIX domain-containing protein [Gammaproteobacteria bacterium]MBU2344860.1 NUDIX domain-containing protein [Gammaproteobacteria bacterium]
MSRPLLHLTVAAVLYFQGRYLLVEEKDKVSGRLVLNQPAGHVEENEDLISAVKRELQEETGLSLEPDAWLGISQLKAANGHFYVRVNFVFTPTELPTQYQPQDDDIRALHWLNFAELKTHTLPPRSQLVLDAITQFEQKQWLPLSQIKNPIIHSD